MKSAADLIPLEKLIEELPSTYTLADKDLIQRAYRVAEEVIGAKLGFPANRTSTTASP